MTREKFLHSCGAMLAGGSIVAISTILLRRRYEAKKNPDNVCKNRFPNCEGCTLNCTKRK